MIKVPPTTQKIVVTPHKVDHVDENVLSIQIIQHVVEFIHAYWFGFQELDFQSFIGIGC